MAGDLGTGAWYTFTLVSAKLAMSSLPDAYACLYVSGTLVDCTGYVSNEKNPIWNKAMNAFVAPSDSLVIEVWDDYYGLPDVKIAAVEYKPAKQFLKAGGTTGEMYPGAPHELTWKVVAK